jgi:hypothetical protein
MIRPADGERAAVGGFSAQYRVAAALIYRSVWKGRLEFIRLADPEAGRVDDIQIATPGQLDAYQVKWSAKPSSLTFSALVSADAEKPALIKQLADGWKALTASNVSRQVRVHLVSRDYPSTHDSFGKKADGTSSGSFSDLWVNVLQPLAKGQITKADVPDVFADALERIRTSADLADAELEPFLRCCSLDLMSQIGTANDGSEIDEPLERDLSELAAHLQRIVAADRRIVEVRAQELLDQLGWTKKLKHHFRHRFAVDERIYQPIERTRDAVGKAISAYKNGYLALVGGPGTGKSTLLTQTLRYTKGLRVIRYYAYVHDDPAHGRGEAHSFLHDLFVELHEQNVGRARKLPETTSELRQAFSEQLAALSQEYQEHQIKTVILIDGLDHIEREQKPERSLISELPLPNQVPEGVLFVLGTQKIELRDLSDTIKAELTEPGRTIEMEPLSRLATMAILDRAGLPYALYDTHRERFWEICAGHPLATTYMAERLRQVESLSEADEALKSSAAFGGAIDKTYEVYWLSCKESSVRDLLGLACRLRVPIDIDKLDQWCGHSVVEQFYETAHHFFRKASRNRWTFFHNSFKQFLLQKTSSKLGNVDPALDCGYHERLATFTQAANEDVWKWESLYHHARAGNWEKVAALGIQPFFRNQFLSLRPLDLIVDDIRLLLEAGRQRLDGLLAARAWLIEAELKERLDNLSQCDWERYLPVFLGVDKLMRVSVGLGRLYIDPGHALTIAADYAEADHLIEAKELFDLAEPLSLLSGVRLMAYNESSDSLVDWVRLAPLFRTTEQIARGITNIRTEPGPLTQIEDADEQAKQIRQHLRFELGLGILDLQDEQRWTEFEQIFSKEPGWAELRQSIVLSACVLHPLSSYAAEQIPMLRAAATAAGASDWIRLAVGELMLRHTYPVEEVRQLVHGTGQPDLHRDDVRSESFSDLRAFWKRIRLNRLLSALGQSVDPSVAVPPPDDKRYTGVALFERNLVLVANVWGKAIGGTPQDPGIILDQLRPALRLYYGGGSRHLGGSEDYWTHWYSYVNAAAEYFKFIIRAVSAHGRSAVEQLGTELERLWTETDPNAYWPLPLRREIARTLFRYGDGQENFVRRIDAIDRIDISDDDLHTRITHYLEQARAWHEAGNSEKASLELPRALSTSFGIYHRKDRQFQHWIDWLFKVGPGRAVNETLSDIHRFASALVQVERGGRGRGNQEGAAELMRLAWRVHPSYALQLDRWLREARALEYGPSLQGALVGSLERPDRDLVTALHIAENLGVVAVLPDSEIVSRHLAGGLLDDLGKVDAEAQIRHLVHCVEIDEYPKARRAWYEGIAAAYRARGTNDDFASSFLKTEPDDDRSTEPAVKMRNGEKLSQKRAMERVYDFQSFIDFADAVEEARYLRWDRLLETVLPSCSEKQIDEVLKRLEGQKREKLISARIAERLLALGLKDKALDVARAAYESGEKYGWITHMDGGSKIVPAALLIKAAPEVWGPKILRDLLNDYAQEVPYARDFAHGLDDLLNLLGLHDKLGDLWVEIRQHVFQLFEFAEEFSKDVPNIPETPTVSVRIALSELALADLLIPIPEMQERHVRALTKIALSRSAEEVVHGLVKRIGLDNPTNALYVPIAALCFQGTETHRAELRSTLQQAALDADIGVRALAMKAFNRTGQSSPPVQKENFQVPLTYAMKLKEPHSLEPSLPDSAITPDKPLHVGTDPVDLLSPFVDELQLLAEIADIPIANLLERGVQLMHQIAPRATWDVEAERQLQSYLAAIDLKLRFTRPKSRVADLAVRRVAAELLDAGRLSPDTATDLGLARIFDERLLFLTPSVRPQWVQVPPELGIAEPTTSWTTIDDRCFGRFAFQSPDAYWVVVGEITRTQILNWGVPSETRAALIATRTSPRPRRDAEMSRFFPARATWRADAYPRVSGTPVRECAVIYGYEYRLRFADREWLAINPWIASALRWTPHPEVPFSWLQDGKLVAQSVCWQDGPYNRQPPGGEVCSQGWLVLVARSAMLELLRILGPATRVQRLRRAYSGEEGRSAVNELREAAA